MENSLELVDDEDDCIVCYLKCKTKTLCCKNYLCKECTTKWWEYKRQCPACKEDMLNFNLWVDKYKNDNKQLVDEDSILLTDQLIYTIISELIDLLQPGDTTNILQSNIIQEISESLNQIIPSIAEDCTVVITQLNN